MRSAVCIVLLASLLACNNKELADQSATGDTSTTSQTLPSKFERLLSLYPVLTFDSLNIESPIYDSVGNLQGTIIGKPLDSIAFSQFSALLGRELEPLSEGYFAYGRFEVSNGVIALITRIPGMYSPSKVHLYLVDAQRGVLLNDAELSEHWGDAGDVFIKRSVLHNAKPEILIDIEEESMYYHSIEDERNDSVTVGDLRYRLLLSRDRRDSIYVSSSKRTVLDKSKDQSEGASNNS